MESTANTFNAIDLVNKLESHDKACASRFSKAVERIMQGMATQNDDVTPKQDELGRLHAPYDGYEVDGTLYNKGRYIPMPTIEGDDLFFSGNTKRFEFEAKRLVGEGILAALIALDKDKIKGATFSFGKQFNRSGSIHAYIYIKSISLGFLNIFTNFIDEAMDKVRDAQKANKGIAPEGRLEIVGTVTGLPVKENPYAYNSYLYKITIELENGSTVHGTLPNSISNVNVGDKVKMVGTCKQAEDDNTHAYFSRPAKAAIIAD